MINLKKKKRNNSKKIIVIVFIAIIVLFLATLNINDVTITGNQYYSEEQIKEIVKIDESSNTIAFLLKNKIKPIGEIPFLDKIDISLDSLNSLHINVYEKKVIGCTQYMSLYLYFDREGVIVETSTEKREEILEIKGLKYGSAVMLQQLPVNNSKIFDGILELMQLIDKYKLDIDEVIFDSMYNITLKSAGIRIKCGQAEELHRKISKLEKVLPELEGKQGELNLQYANKNILFKENIEDINEVEQEENMMNEDNEGSEEKVEGTGN